MKYLITLKDSNIHVEPAEKPVWWHGDTTLASLPQIGQDFFEHHEYCTLEFDDITGQMRVWHPKESHETMVTAQPFSVYRKYINSSNHWRDEKTYQVSIYSDGHHTCTCPAWFYFSPVHCKHVEAILSRTPFGQIWETLQGDDRDEFRKEQSRIYDSRAEDSDGEAPENA